MDATEPAATRRLPEVLVDVGLALLAFALVLPGAVLAGEAPYERDIHGVWLAQSHAFVAAVRAGSWPLWNPWLGFGEPMLANPTMQVLYPTTWLQLLLPAPAWYVLHVAGHLVLSAVGLRVLARRLGLDAVAARVAVAVWLLSGPLLSLVNVWHHFAGVCWMPWILAAADEALEHPSWPAARRWGALVGLQLLAGSPDACLLTGVATLFVVARQWPAREHRGAALRTLGTAAGIALVLSVGQWLPTLLVARGGVRVSMADVQRAMWSLDPLALLQVVLPVFFTELPSISPEAALRFDLWSPFLGSVHLGLPTVALVAAAVAAREQRWARPVLGGVIVIVLVALGRHTPVHDLALLLLPPLRLLRYPIKFMVLAALGVALLSGAGAHALPRVRRAALVPLLVATVAAAVLAATVAGLAATLFPPAPGVEIAPLLAGTRRLLALSALAGAAALAALRWAPSLVAVMAVLQLALVHAPLNPTVSSAFFRFRPQTLKAVTPSSRVFAWDYQGDAAPDNPRRGNLGKFLEARPGLPPGLARAIGYQTYLYPPSAARWGLFGSYDTDLLGLLPPAPVRAAQLVRMTEGTPSHLRLLQLGGVQHVVSFHRSPDPALAPRVEVEATLRAPVLVADVPAPLPRAYAVAGVRAPSLPQDAVGSLLDPAFDPRGEVLVSNAAPRAPRGGLQPAHVVDWRPDAIELETSVDGPSTVVVLESASPGWKATVDGAEAPVLTVNALFRGVAVGPGTHRVRLRYRPGIVLAAVAVTACAAVLLAVDALRTARRARRTRS